MFIFQGLTYQLVLISYGTFTFAMFNYPITPPQDGHSIETVTVGYTFGSGTFSDIHSSASIPTLLNQMTGENTGKCSNLSHPWNMLNSCCVEIILVNINNKYVCIFCPISMLRWCDSAKSFIVENNDLFILNHKKYGY